MKTLLLNGDLVCVHDFQLIPLGAMLRELGLQQRIGFFLHTPFPKIDALRRLANAYELLNAFQCYDLLGFQTRADLESFQTAAALFWGPGSLIGQDLFHYNARRIAAAVFPVGVDVDGIRREGSSTRAVPPCFALPKRPAESRLMVGFDRIDFIKGLPERLMSYEAFLESYPERRRRSCFHQIGVPSRIDIPANTQLCAALHVLSQRVNSRFADLDWEPLRFTIGSFPHAAIMRLLRIAQIGIVTSLRDGMNLVAKEYVGAQNPDDPGVLILSAYAGAARERSSALQVDPYDAWGYSRAIELALDMPLAERRARHRAMLDALRVHDLRAWHTGFVNRLPQIDPAPRAESERTVRLR